MDGLFRHPRVNIASGSTYKKKQGAQSARDEVEMNEIKTQTTLNHCEHDDIRTSNAKCALTVEKHAVRPVPLLKMSDSLSRMPRHDARILDADGGATDLFPFFRAVLLVRSQSHLTFSYLFFPSFRVFFSFSRVTQNPPHCSVKV